MRLIEQAKRWLRPPPAPEREEDADRLAPARGVGLALLLGLLLWVAALFSL